MQTTKALGARLKAARLKLNLTQERAARRWGVSLRNLQAWEEGAHQPLQIYRVKLERILARVEEQGALRGG
jgi:DNA-binding transcriptional regulator YiaG